MKTQGQFDPQLLPDGWFDAGLAGAWWFDPALPAGPADVTGTAALAGAPAILVAEGAQTFSGLAALVAPAATHAASGAVEAPVVATGGPRYAYFPAPRLAPPVRGSGRLRGRAALMASRGAVGPAPVSGVARLTGLPAALRAAGGLAFVGSARLRGRSSHAAAGEIGRGRDVRDAELIDLLLTVS